MPISHYMVCDPRRDHSLRIPRPDLTVDLNVPNACNGCHNDVAKGETPRWAAEQCASWYGAPQGPRHFAHALDAGRKGKLPAVAMLNDVARRTTTWAPVRASAVLLLGRYGPEAARSAGYAALKDPEPLVRTSAIRALEGLPPDQMVARIVPLLHDPVRSVRTEAARAVVLARLDQADTGFPLEPGDREALRLALDEYLAGQDAMADRPGAHLNRAVIFESQGDTDRALAEYETALRLDAGFVPARVNRALLRNQLGHKAQAEADLRAVVAAAPDYADGFYWLGLLVAEDPARLAEAAEWLDRAARLAPANARIHYNHGLALQQLGRLDEAETALRSAYERSPAVDYLYALALLFAERKDWPKARKCVDGLIQMDPQSRQWPALREQMQEAEEPPRP